MAIAWAMGSQARPLASPFGLAYRPRRLPSQDTATTPLAKPTSSPALGSEKELSSTNPSLVEPFSPIKPFVHRYELRPSEGLKRANRVKGYEGKGIHRNVGIALEGSRRTQEGFLGLKVCPYLREEVRGLLGLFFDLKSLRQLVNDLTG